jgi:hypothetical protein
MMVKTSVLEHRRYLRSEKASHDKCQRVLSPLGSEPNPRPYSVVPETLLDPEKNTTCPFCLGLSKFRLFLVSSKKGFNRYMGKCPLCEHNVTLKTLKNMTVWGPEEFAKFVAEYSTMGFWKKINFKTWTNRLKLMGWTSEFWDRYHEIRGTDNKNYKGPGSSSE